MATILQSISILFLWVASSYSTFVKYNVTVIKEYNAQNGSSFFVCHGSVADFDGDAIVNAANERMVGGGGLDGIITYRGGNELARMRQQISDAGGCETGDAKVTGPLLLSAPDNKLYARYVIHAVGPDFRAATETDTESDTADKQLYDAYASVLKLAKQHDLKTIGVCLLSASVFRGAKSLENVLQIGVQAIKDHMYDNVQVYMVAYTPREIGVLPAVASCVFDGTEFQEEEDEYQDEFCDPMISIKLN